MVANRSRMGPNGLILRKRKDGWPDDQKTGDGGAKRKPCHELDKVSMKERKMST